MMDIKILVADDDAVFRELVCDILHKESWECIQAGNGQEALDLFFAVKGIDLVILDVMMPIYDGLAVLREIRDYSDIPVLMLTALGDARNEVVGLRQGADEYIAKPFGYEVFVARLHALLRKAKKDKLSEVKIGELSIDRVGQKVKAGEVFVELNRKEYQLLLYLVKNRNIVLQRGQLLDAVWGYDYDGDIRTIDTHIKTLRAKLLQCGEYIKTIRGSGYRFEGA